MLCVSCRSVPDVDAQRFREEGNACFRSKDYQQALDKYTAALNGWPDSTTFLHGIMANVVPALLNRAACALELGDRATGRGRDRQQLYEHAIRDTEEAIEFGGLRCGVSKESAKALYRRGRAHVSLSKCRLDEVAAKAHQEYSSQLKEAVQRVPEVEEVVQLFVVKGLRLAVQDLGVALDQNKQLGLGCRQAQEHLRLAKAQLLRVDEEPNLVVGEDAALAVNVAAHAESVIFRAGATWMANQVSLEVPIRCSNNVVTELPVYLLKQPNTNNFGELAVFIMCSDHLGAETLAQRGEPLGVDVKNELVSHLSDPSEEQEELRCAQEFMMSLNLARTQPDTVQALVDKGLIMRKRMIGATPFGEHRVVYSVNF